MKRYMLLFNLMGIALAIASCTGNGQTNDNAYERTTVDSAQKTTNTAPSPSNPISTVPEVIPAFTFFKANSGIKFTRDDLAKKGNIVLIFFDPGCSHCQDETRDIGKNYQKVKTANFYFIAMQDPSLMEGFINTYGGELKGKSNVTLLYDRNMEFLPKFNPKQYPAVYVYGSDHKLRAHWDGEKKIGEIIEAINSK